MQHSLLSSLINNNFEHTISKDALETFKQHNLVLDKISTVTFLFMVGELKEPKLSKLLFSFQNELSLKFLSSFNTENEDEDAPHTPSSSEILLKLMQDESLLLKHLQLNSCCIDTFDNLHKNPSALFSLIHQLFLKIKLKLDSLSYQEFLTKQEDISYLNKFLDTLHQEVEKNNIMQDPLIQELLQSKDLNIFTFSFDEELSEEEIKYNHLIQLFENLINSMFYCYLVFLKK